MAGLSSEPGAAPSHAGRGGLWSPRLCSASGAGQAPVGVGSWDSYFSSDQSQEIDWKLSVTTETTNYIQFKVNGNRFFHPTQRR